MIPKCLDCSVYKHSHTMRKWNYNKSKASLETLSKSNDIKAKLTVTTHTLTNSIANETAACTSLAGPTKRCKRCGETTRAYEITQCKYDITRCSINSLKTQYSNHVTVHIYATTIHIKQRFSIINNKVANDNGSRSGRICNPFSTTNRVYMPNAICL